MGETHVLGEWLLGPPSSILGPVHQYVAGLQGRGWGVEGSGAAPQLGSRAQCGDRPSFLGPNIHQRAPWALEEGPGPLADGSSIRPWTVVTQVAGRAEETDVEETVLEE